MSRTHPVWYRLHPGIAVAVAGGLFVAISILRLLSSSDEAVAILYTLPIALLAVTFGRAGGLIGASVGYLLFAVINLVEDPGGLGALGWVTRAVAMFLLGGLLGQAVDQARGNQRWALAEQLRRLELEEQKHRERAALEINDSLIQGMAAAKWLMEQHKGRQAIDTLESTIEEGGRVVAELLSDSPDGEGIRVMRADGGESGPRIESVG